MLSANLQHKFLSARLNPLKTGPEYTQTGVYGNCMLYQKQIIFNMLI